MSTKLQRYDCKRTVEAYVSSNIEPMARSPAWDCWIATHPTQDMAIAKQMIVIATRLLRDMWSDPSTCHESPTNIR